MKYPVRFPSRLSSEESIWFVALAVSAFLGLGLQVLIHHEMWRDELHAWVIAAESRSISELFANIRYENHTVIWYLCLYLLSRVSDTPLAMQIFHFGVAALGVYLFVRFSPFTKIQKICFILGYFPLFEYGIISRNYVLGLVSLFAFCVLHARAPTGSLAQAAFLALLANTSIYGAMIALAFGLYLAIPWRNTTRRGERNTGQTAVYLLLISIGIGACLLQLMPPPDISPMVLEWNTAPDTQRIERTVSAIWQAYVPIPKPQLHFWETNILDLLRPFHVGAHEIFPSRVVMILSIGLIGVAAWMLARSPALLFVYLVATTEILVFSYFKHYGGIRHGGHLFLTLVACLWLSAQHFRQSLSGARPSLLHPFPSVPVRARLITALFAIQALAGAWAIQADLRFPFSASKETADFIRMNGMEDLTMIGSEHYAASAVAALLNRSMYFAETDRVGTFVTWVNGRRHVSAPELIQKARHFAERDHRDILLIMNYDLGPEAQRLKIRTFDSSIVAGECYALYRLPYVSNISAPASTYEPLPSGNPDGSDAVRPPVCPTK